METNIEKARKALADADAIHIGASNGLSISEGYNIFADNEMFRRQFGDMGQRYGFRNVLQGVFCDFPTQEAHDEFHNRLVKYWVTDYEPSQVMKDLRAIVGRKPYFIITTNCDMHLEKAGFAEDRVWELEGTFVSGVTHELDMSKRPAFDRFLADYGGKRLVVLELGIGSQIRIIKPVLYQVTKREPMATFITLNLPHEIVVPQEIGAKTIPLPGDIANILKELSEWAHRKRDILIV